MNLVYLLDTNVVSELARLDPHPAVLRLVTEHQRACALAATTVEELIFGVARLAESRKRQALESWLSGLLERFVLLPYDDRAAQWLGRERARRLALGRPAPRADAEIAAIAVVNRLTLVTRNTPDFSAYAGLNLENWFEMAK